MNAPNFHDVELLSTFLDGQLEPSDAARIEARLSADPQLRAVLDDLRRSRALLRKVPARRAPRNFTLTPGMAGIEPPAPRAYPALRLATALATFFFAVSIAVNGLVPLASRSLAAAPAPAYGFGGGGGGGGPADTTEAPSEPFAQPMPTAPADSARTVATPAPELQAKSAGSAGGQSAPAAAPSGGAPIPFTWQVGMAALALACGSAAWFIQRAAERNFRKKWPARK